MDRLLDVLENFIDEMKQVDLKKPAKKLIDRLPNKSDLPELHFEGNGINKNDFLLGLVIGGFVGFLISLLFAPKSGEETRALISEKSREVGMLAKDTIEGVADKTSHLAAEGRDKVESVLHKGQKQIDTTKRQGRDFTHDAREELSDTMHRTADEVDPNTRF